MLYKWNGIEIKPLTRNATEDKDEEIKLAEEQQSMFDILENIEI